LREGRKCAALSGRGKLDKVERPGKETPPENAFGVFDLPVKGRFKNNCIDRPK